jgi:hypothetical protein
MESPPFGEGQSLVFISSNARLFASTSFFLPQLPTTTCNIPSAFSSLQNSLSCNTISLFRPSTATKWIASRRK